MKGLGRIAWMRHLLGPALLVLLLSRADARSVLDALGRAQALPLVAACSIVLIAIPLRAWRWADLVEAFGGDLPRRQALVLYARGTFAGTATPGRVGELAKAGPLARRGMPFRRAMTSVLADRACDLAVSLLAALAWGAWMLADPGPTRAIATLGALGAAAAVRRSGRRSFSGRRLARVSVATLVSAAAAWLANHLVVVSLGLPLGILETAGISAAAGLVTLLPISVLGVGTRDATLVLLLARHGIGAGDAVALSTLFLFLNVWTGLACATSLLFPSRGSE